MKTIALLILLSSLSHAASINCATSGTATTCTSSDVPGGNIVPVASTTPTPVSNVVVNNPTGGTVDLVTFENTKPLKTNLFISNSGTAVNINSDVSGKWDQNYPTNGLTHSPDASPLLIVADKIGNISLNISGYVGKNGKSSAEICAAKIIAGDYGTVQKDVFESRCNDTTTGSPCAPAKIRTACDALDVNNLNASSGTPTGLCAAGFAHQLGDDNNANPIQQLTKIVPKTLRKCQRPSFNATVRTCASREFKCRYDVRSNRADSRQLQITAITPSGGTAISRIDTIASITGGAAYVGAVFPHGVAGGSSYHDGTQWRITESLIVSFDVVFKQTSRFDSANNLVCPSVSFFGWDVHGSRYGANYTAAIPPANTDLAYAGLVDISAWSGLRDPYGQSTTGSGHFDYYMKGIKVQILNDLRRDIPDTSGCLSTEVDLGTSATGQLQPIDTQFINEAQACPGPNGTTPGYGNAGLFTDHNLTTPYTNILGTATNPLQVDDITCTMSSCPGALVVSSTETKTQTPLVLGSGEKGSNGSKAVIFTYDVTGTENYSFSHGLNGANGLDNITVPSVTKTCFANSGNGTANPQTIFHQIFWKLFTFSPSATSYNNGFAPRAQDDAVIIMKKISPGIRDLVKEETCPTCPQ